MSATRPILFNGAMVRAILAGSKTQTRRPFASQPVRTVSADGAPMWHLSLRSGFVNSNDEKTWPASMTRHHVDQDGEVYPAVCPFGAAGDRLWVRETWCLLDHDHWEDPSKPRDWLSTRYAPRRNACAYRAETDAEGERIRREYGYRWQPSIHMPRWASRLTLDILSVRVERLQDISEEDARAEGFSPGTEELLGGAIARLDARDYLKNTWEALYGPESWDANPWVWCVGFKKAEGSR